MMHLDFQEKWRMYPQKYEIQLAPLVIYRCQAADDDQYCDLYAEFMVCFVEVMLYLDEVGV
jgi:hypothetical protein